MTKDLTRGTPWKLILQFALPIMAGNLLQQLYNTADTIIVGNFNGQQALSAVGACASLTVLFTALAIGFSIGAGVLISQYFGASRERELRQYAATAIVLMLAMGLFMSLAGVVSARFLLERVLGTPEALLPMTLLYFRIYAAGLVFQFGYNIAAALLRALGDSKATLYFLLVSSILNVALDLAFVAGLGLGVAGGGGAAGRRPAAAPCLYGAIREQMDALDADGIPYDDTPGVSSFCGAAAALNAEYTLPTISQTVIITRMEGRTPVPEKEKLASLAAHGATMVIFLSIGLIDKVQQALLAGGAYTPATPAAVVYKASWPEQKVVRCTVGTLAGSTRANGITKTALIVVGEFLGTRYERSKLYDPTFTTEFRKGADQ